MLLMLINKSPIMDKALKQIIEKEGALTVLANLRSWVQEHELDEGEIELLDYEARLLIEAINR